MFEMMDDADREGDVETLGERKIVDARPYHLDAGEGGQVAARLRQGPLVDIDRAPLPRPVLHWPKAVAAHAAADIEKALAAPVPGREVHGPAAELLFVFRQDLAVGVPLVAEAVWRTGEIACVGRGPGFSPGFGHGSPHRAAAAARGSATGGAKRGSATRNSTVSAHSFLP